jgi:hypothetical protein
MEVQGHTLDPLEIRRSQKYQKDYEEFKRLNGGVEFKNSKNPFAQKIDNPHKNQFFASRADKFLRTWKR